MYTKEENKEIERVMDVFSEYICSNPYFDVVWSDKLGYVILDGLSKDMDSLCLAPEIVRDGASICDKAVYNIACDVMVEQGKTLDLYSCGETEKRDIRKALSPYMEQLPEYRYLVDNLFVKK